MVKFDVTDGTYLVVSLAKMIETSFTFSFDDYKCHIHKGNRRVEMLKGGMVGHLGVGKMKRWV